MTISVLLLDDHEIVRRGIAQLLETENDIEVVGEASTTARARTLGAGDVITPPTVAAGCRVAGGAMPPSSEQ